MVRFTQPSALNNAFEVNPVLSGLAPQPVVDETLASTLESEVRRIYEAIPEPLALITALLYADPRLSRESAKALDTLVKQTYEKLRTT